MPQKKGNSSLYICLINWYTLKASFGRIDSYLGAGHIIWRMAASMPGNQRDCKVEMGFVRMQSDPMKEVEMGRDGRREGDFNCI